jgi:hypothetical protein
MSPSIAPVLSEARANNRRRSKDLMSRSEVSFAAVVLVVLMVTAGANALDRLSASLHSRIDAVWSEPFAVTLHIGIAGVDVTIYRGR